MPKVLLVDDDDAIRKMLRLTLAYLGYDVVEACDGREAIAMLETHTTDVVLTDLIMPEMEGIELIREIRKRKGSIPIVAMSGGGHIDSKSLLNIANHLGANRVLAKPFSNDELSAALSAVLPEKSD